MPARSLWAGKRNDAGTWLATDANEAAIRARVAKDRRLAEHDPVYTGNSPATRRLLSRADAETIRSLPLDVLRRTGAEVLVHVCAPPRGLPARLIHAGALVQEAAGTSTTAAASGPVHPQTMPILIGALALLAPAACGVLNAVVAATPPANNNVAVSAATLRRRLLITIAPVLHICRLYERCVSNTSRNGCRVRGGAPASSSPRARDWGGNTRRFLQPGKAPEVLGNRRRSACPRSDAVHSIMSTAYRS